MSKPIQKRPLLFTNNLSIRTNRWSNLLIKITLGIHLRLMYNAHPRNTDSVKNISGPVVFVPNHTTMFDPFLLAVFMRRRIYYVTSDTQIRNPFVFFFSRLVGTLPISSGISDIKTVRAVMKIIRSGHSLCIYPEGQQTWDGTTLPLIDTCVKLVKLLKVPVVRVLTKGSFTTRPRWAKNRRRGKIVMDFKLLFSAEELKRLSFREIREKLGTELVYNEWEYLSSHPVRFYNARGARDMAKALYMCPSCNAIGHMHGQGRTLYCGKCGYSVKYTDSGVFAPGNGSLYFKDMHSWNQWQRNALKAYIREKCASEESPLLMLNSATLHTGFRMEPMKKAASGMVCLYPDRICFRSEDKTKTYIFKTAEIGAMSLLRNYFEFYSTNGILYRFKLNVSEASSLKWNTAITILQNMEKENIRLSVQAEAYEPALPRV